MNFSTPYTSKAKPEKNLGERITESAGYIPPKRQIEEMILAGKRLSEFRAEMYDYPDAKSVPEDIQIDPTRSPAFDMADATQLAEETERRLQYQAKRSKEEKELTEKLEQAQAEKTEKAPE